MQPWATSRARRPGWTRPRFLVSARLVKGAYADSMRVGGSTGDPSDPELACPGASPVWGPQRSGAGATQLIDQFLDLSSEAIEPLHFGAVPSPVSFDLVRGQKDAAHITTDRSAWRFLFDHDFIVATAAGPVNESGQSGGCRSDIASAARHFAACRRLTSGTGHGANSDASSHSRLSINWGAGGPVVEVPCHS